MNIRRIVLTIILLHIISFGYVSGVSPKDEVTVTGYAVNNKTPALVMEQNGNYGLLIFLFDNTNTWSLIQLDDDMNLIPLRVYRASEPKGYTIYPSSIIPYDEGFLIAGAIDSGNIHSNFHGGFWVAYLNKKGDILWERAYLTRSTSSISKVLVDKFTGKILLVGSGSFYSGSDGFIGIFNPETRKLERLVAIGGLYADGIDAVLVLKNSYIVVGSSWSLGDTQGKVFILKFTKDLSILNSIAYTLLDGGTPVRSADWWTINASYSNNTIKLFGEFLVKKYSPVRTTLQKSGLWWMTIDKNLNPIYYSFKEAIVNSSPIELGYSGVLTLYHLPVANESLIVSGIYKNYERFFVGWIHNSSIDGYFVNVNRSPVTYYPSTIPPFTSVFSMDNSLVLLLTATRYSDTNFKIYNPLLAIRIPYTKLHNPSELSKSFLYGGNFSIQLRNTGFRIKAGRYIAPYNIKLLNVEMHPGNISIVPVDSALNLVELRNPKPMVEVEIIRGKNSQFPKDASIYVDNTKINVSSVTTLYLLPGTHNVTVTRPGFISHTEKIHLQAFVSYGFHVDVLASFLRLSVSPKNATIKIICPISYRPTYKFTFNLTPETRGIILPTSYHCLVTAIKDGYVPQSKKIWTFGAINLTFNLRPEPATLVISSNPSARVLINGKMYNITPLTVTLNPGNYSVVLSREGYQNYSMNITLDPGETRKLDITLTPVTPSTTSSMNTSSSVTHDKTSSAPAQNMGTQPLNEKRNICGPAFIGILALLVLMVGKRET
ncbi:PEGA domain-containing protein [Thermococcus sp.]|uniref:PEGA domain-containing protein n=1 Tax=Thermococcus sp. TaxID=35749 RepID=UPI00260A3FEB|nr:PEGA domain-containing protein [Thermococcus sp.]